MVDGARVEAGSECDYILAGNATFTLVSPATGARFTYRVRRPDEDSPWFVSLLTGPDNEGDYRYLGFTRDGAELRWSRKSCAGEDAASFKAIAWVLARLARGLDLRGVEVWHLGRCGRCGRSLTVPESIASGLGPICAERMAA